MVHTRASFCFQTLVVFSIHSRIHRMLQQRCRFFQGTWTRSDEMWAMLNFRHLEPDTLPPTQLDSGHRSAGPHAHTRTRPPTHSLLPCNLLGRPTGSALPGLNCWLTRFPKPSIYLLGHAPATSSSPGTTSIRGTPMSDAAADNGRRVKWMTRVR